MVILKDLLLIIAEVLGAGAVVFGAVFAVHKWVLRQNNQDNEIKSLKEEQTVICYGVLAALKGLKEQGCNGPVTEAINTIEKHLNKKAHK
ncbi:MAG: branched-chain amino acid ABC transporter permease [Clostridia bacterium]|nr:branched-chain amino acid ABC transporter permease [Clostridia bacterium]